MQHNFPRLASNRTVSLRTVNYRNYLFFFLQTTRCRLCKFVNQTDRACCERAKPLKCDIEDLMNKTNRSGNECVGDLSILATIIVPTNQTTCHCRFNSFKYQSQDAESIPFSVSIFDSFNFLLHCKFRPPSHSRREQRDVEQRGRQSEEEQLRRVDSGGNLDDYMLHGSFDQGTMFFTQETCHCFQRSFLFYFPTLRAQEGVHASNPVFIGSAWGKGISINSFAESERNRRLGLPIIRFFAVCSVALN